jgi:hypothetical protein
MVDVKPSMRRAPDRCIAPYSPRPAALICCRYAGATCILQLPALHSAMPGPGPRVFIRKDVPPCGATPRAQFAFRVADAPALPWSTLLDSYRLAHHSKPSATTVDRSQSEDWSAWRAKGAGTEFRKGFMLYLLMPRVLSALS